MGLKRLHSAQPHCTALSISYISHWFHTDITRSSKYCHSLTGVHTSGSACHNPGFDQVRSSKSPPASLCTLTAPMHSCLRNFRSPSLLPSLYVSSEAAPAPAVPPPHGRSFSPSSVKQSQFLTHNHATGPNLNADPDPDPDPDPTTDAEPYAYC